MSKKQSLGGRHIARTHTTTAVLASQVARSLNESGLITKLSLSYIDPKGGSSIKRLVLTRRDHGLRVMVHESALAQELYVSAPDRERVIVYLQDWCGREGLLCTLR